MIAICGSKQASVAASYVVSGLSQPFVKNSGSSLSHITQYGITPFIILCFTL